MIVGFVGFGEVAYNLSNTLLNNDVDVISSTKGRSKKTKEIAIQSGVELVNSYEELAKQSDILISSATPYSAFDIAKKYGTLTKGIFLDLNNVSPKTVEKIDSLFSNEDNSVGDKDENLFSNKNSFSPINPIFVNGAIIGKVTDENHVIYVSGKHASKIAILNNYGLNIKVISGNIADSSALKMLRSIYTKGVTAIAYEMICTASELGLTDELFETIAITEGEEFISKTKSRVNSLAISHLRKFQEMDEALKFLKDIFKEDDFEFNSLTLMTKATKEKFRKLTD